MQLSTSMVIVPSDRLVVALVDSIATSTLSDESLIIVDNLFPTSLLFLVSDSKVKLLIGVTSLILYLQASEVIKKLQDLKQGLYNPLQYLVCLKIIVIMHTMHVIYSRFVLTIIPSYVSLST